MPQLKTYTAGLISPETGFTRATPSSMGGAIGEGLAAVGVGIRRLQVQTEEDESRTALVGAAQIRAKYAKLLDEATISGGDTAELKEQMDGELSKIGENFSTKKGQDSLVLHAANTGLVFDEQANRIAITRAASAARLQGKEFLDSESATIQSNPSYLATAEQNAEAFSDTLVGISPGARAEIMQGLKGELNAAAAMASARIDPVATKMKLEAGEWALTPEQRRMAIGQADTQIRAVRADEDHQRVLADWEARKADESARDMLFKGIIDGTTRRKDIMDNADLRPQTREHLIVFMEHRAKELREGVKKSSPVAMRNLWLAIHAPDDDPRKIFTGDDIFKAVEKGLINTTDANQLNTLVANQKDENNRTIGSRLANQMNIVGRALSQDPSFIAQPALVAEIQMDYQARVYEKVSDLRVQKKNPNEIFNPASKEYVGSKEFIQQSIDNVRASDRLLGVAISQPIVFPDGVTRKWNGQEPRTDIKNWLPITSSLVEQIPQ